MVGDPRSPAGAASAHPSGRIRDERRAARARTPRWVSGEPTPYPVFGR
ncbi:hypothetical protein Pd630_LPD04817 [Rhodococcus opacus PD630]|nr:hypothetical protein Pd630_LPD04817 [Rhodococcus opacus PD630]